MEESSSNTSTKPCDYLSLLCQIEELSNLVIKCNNPDHGLREPSVISALEEIFENLTINIKKLAIKWCNPDSGLREPLDNSALKAIFENQTIDIENLSNGKKAVKKV